MDTAIARRPHVLIFSRSALAHELIQQALVGLDCRFTFRRSIRDHILEVCVSSEPDVMIFDHMWWADIDDIWTTLSTIRNTPSTRETPIILFTCRSQHVEDAEPFLNDLNISLLYKPIDLSSLRSRIEDTLAGGKFELGRGEESGDTSILEVLRSSVTFPAYHSRDTRRMEPLEAFAPISAKPANNESPSIPSEVPRDQADPVPTIREQPSVLPRTIVQRRARNEHATFASPSVIEHAVTHWETARTSHLHPGK